ncbi:hypothetical protein ACVW19_005552 [Streptomyces sp. TE5632]
MLGTRVFPCMPLRLHGTLDVLLPIGKGPDVHAQMIKEAGRGGLHRYYRIEDGTHTGSLVDAFPDRLRPLLPCHRSSFTALEKWLSTGHRPPASHTVARPEDADPAALLTSCRLDK